MELLKYIFILFFFISIFSFFSLAPWVPTKKSDLFRINEILKLKEWEKFLEIWCWDARVSIFIAKNNPNSKIIWVEFSPLFYLISKIKVFFSWFKNIEIIYWNALKMDLLSYDSIYIFWLPNTIKDKLFPFFDNKIKENFRIISYCFRTENNYFSEEVFRTEKELPIFLYNLKQKK